MRLLSISLIAAALLLTGCDKSSDTTSPDEATDADPFAGKEVVENTEAQPGDVTICPYSGKKFIVKADHPKFDYNGKTYVFCGDRALEAIEADPEKYLGPADGESETAEESEEPAA